MNGFQYYAPTKVVFGKGTENRVAELVKEFGGNKLLVHYGGGSVQRSGLLDKVLNLLQENHIDYVTLGGVVPNPRLSLVYEGIRLCKEEGVDFILAVGGGSVIDSAKAIGYGVANEGDVWELYEQKRKAVACVPIGVILTLSATGSEMSSSSVITKEEGWLKRGYGSDLGRPKFAIMNPELTMTLPDYQTACGCTDIMMHTMERYFSRIGNMELTDALAEGLLRTVMENARILMKEPSNYDARAEIMWTGNIAHNDLLNKGRVDDWASHNIEHELSALYDITHGAGLSIVTPAWMRHVYKSNKKRFVQFAQNVEKKTYLILRKYVPNVVLLLKNLLELKKAGTETESEAKIKRNTS